MIWWYLLRLCQPSGRRSLVLYEEAQREYSDKLQRKKHQLSVAKASKSWQRKYGRNEYFSFCFKASIIILSRAHCQGRVPSFSRDIIPPIILPTNEDKYINNLRCCYDSLLHGRLTHLMWLKTLCLLSFISLCLWCNIKERGVNQKPLVISVACDCQGPRETSPEGPRASESTLPHLKWDNKCWRLVCPGLKRLPEWPQWISNRSKPNTAVFECLCEILQDRSHGTEFHVSRTWKIIGGVFVPFNFLIF